MIKKIIRYFQLRKLYKELDRIHKRLFDLKYEEVTGISCYTPSFSRLEYKEKLMLWKNEILSKIKELELLNTK